MIKSEFKFSVIGGKTIERLIRSNIPACMRVVRDAYVAHGEGATVNPASMFLRFPDKPTSRIIALPAHIGGEPAVSGLKWIASFPDNIRHGIQRASAVLILNNHDTGYPFACLESSGISAARTAASAVLAALHARRGQRRVSSLGIVGNGYIARNIYDFLLADGWDIDEVRLCDTNPQDSERFRSKVCQATRHARVQVTSLDELLRSSQLIVLATTAPSPYIHDVNVFSHNPLVLNISLRDIAPEIILAAQNVVDDVEHVMHANTSPHLAEQLTGNRDFVQGTIPDMIAGRCLPSPDRPTIISPFGLGVLDVAVGSWIYKMAIDLGEAVAIDDFFPTLER